LKISDSVLNDSGIYSVVASNKAGSDKTSGRLEIEKDGPIDNKPIINPAALQSLNRPAVDQPKRRDSDQEPMRPARVVAPLKNTQVSDGKPVRLVCKVDGYPKPSVVWYKNGAPLPASNRYTPEYDLKTGVAALKLNDAQLNDAGFYEVFVENPMGSDKTNASLIVTPSASIDKAPIVDPRAFKYLDPTLSYPKEVPAGDEEGRPEPPRVIIPLKDIRVNESQPVNLLTKITGYPIPKITWLHNQQPLLESNRYS
jgi:hypothetical protein